MPELGRCIAQVGLYEQETTCVASDIFSEFASYQLTGNHINGKELEFIKHFTGLSLIDQIGLLTAILVFFIVLGVAIKQVCFRKKVPKVTYDALNTTDVGSSTDTTNDNDQRSFIKH